MMHHVLVAFGLTILAGLSTGIGSALAFFADRTNKRFLAGSLGFSAGVMLYVSFVELFAQARLTLTAALGTVPGTWLTVGAFFGGLLLIGVIDRLVPAIENPHEMHSIEDLRERPADSRDHALLRMGLLMALAISIHNFPEGLATFVSAVSDLKVGAVIAVAIAIHNIPEGIAVSVPVFYATGSRRKAFAYSFLSGLAEPLGAVVGFVLLRSVVSAALEGVLFAVVAGIMVFISLDELLPSAQRYGEHHLSVYGLTAGMAVMAVSLLLFL